VDANTVIMPLLMMYAPARMFVSDLCVAPIPSPSTRTGTAMRSVDLLDPTTGPGVHLHYCLAVFGVASRLGSLLII